MKRIQANSPTILEMIGTVPGNELIERKAHYMLHKWKSHGEWFHYEEPVKAFIQFWIMSQDWTNAIRQHCSKHGQVTRCRRSGSTIVFPRLNAS